MIIRACISNVCTLQDIILLHGSKIHVVQIWRVGSKGFHFSWKSLVKSTSLSIEAWYFIWFRKKGILGVFLSIYRHIYNILQRVCRIQGDNFHKPIWMQWHQACLCLSFLRGCLRCEANLLEQSKKCECFRRSRIGVLMSQCLSGRKCTDYFP